MFRIGIREAQPAVHIRLMPFVARDAFERLLVLAVGEQRRIAGLCRMLVHRIGVGRALVFGGRSREVPALEQDLREQEVRVRAVGILGEERQVLPVPVRGFPVVADLAVLLRLGMVVLREIGQVGLEVRRDGGVLFRRIAHPELAVHAVALRAPGSGNRRACRPRLPRPAAAALWDGTDPDRRTPRTPRRRRRSAPCSDTDHRGSCR